MIQLAVKMGHLKTSIRVLWRIIKTNQRSKSLALLREKLSNILLRKSKSKTFGALKFANSIKIRVQFRMPTPRFRMKKGNRRTLKTALKDNSLLESDQLRDPHAHR